MKAWMEAVVDVGSFLQASACLSSMKAPHLFGTGKLGLKMDLQAPKA